jgi:hypothetical protein
MQINRAIIEAAIAGFEQQKRQIDETITELKAQLNGSATGGCHERHAEVYSEAPHRTTQLQHRIVGSVAYLYRRGHSRLTAQIG